jgi:hypothetical protein
MEPSGAGCRYDLLRIIVLPVGGDKGSQAKDIAWARGFWDDCVEAKGHGKATSGLECWAGAGSS